MATTLALTVLALAAALSFLLRNPVARAGAMSVALVGAPVMLLTQIWDTSPVEYLLGKPLLLILLIILGVAGLAGGAVLANRYPLMVPIAVAAALPFRVPIEIGSGEPVNLLLPLYFVTGAAAISWIWNRTRAEGASEVRDPNPGGADIALLAVVVLYAVQSLWAGDQTQAAKQIAFFYVPFAILFVVLRTMEWSLDLVKRCLTVTAGIAVVLAVIGLVEYQTRHVFLNPKIIASNQIEDVFRVNSLFFDPNIFGRYLALVILALCAWALWERGNRTLAKASALIALLWLALMVTFSQTSLLALLIGLAVLGGLWFGAWRALAVSTVAVVVGLMIVFAAGDVVNTSNRSADEATSGRTVLVSGGLKLFAEHPIVGVGSGDFSREYRASEKRSARAAVNASHTIPLTIAAEQGIIGLGAYLTLIWLIFRRLLKDAALTAARAGIVAMVAALVFHTLGYAAFLEDPMLWVLLAAGLALSDLVLPPAPPRARLKLRRKPEAPRERRPLADEQPIAPVSE